MFISAFDHLISKCKRFKHFTNLLVCVLLPWHPYHVIPKGIGLTWSRDVLYIGIVNVILTGPDSFVRFPENGNKYLIAAMARERWKHQELRYSQNCKWSINCTMNLLQKCKLCPQCMFRSPNNLWRRKYASYILHSQGLVNYNRAVYGN